MNRTNGKIAEQSRQKIAQALLSVMGQYSYREITITQLAQEAGLSRKTFYRLFDSKEDVLSLVFEILYRECLARFRVLNIQRYWDAVQCYFDFWEERKALLMLFGKSDLLPVLFDGAYKYSFSIFELVRSTKIASSYSEQLPYLLAYSVGGMHSMLLRWVENDMSVPSEVLIGMLKKGFSSPDI